MGGKQGFVRSGRRCVLRRNSSTRLLEACQDFCLKQEDSQLVSLRKKNPASHNISKAVPPDNPKQSQSWRTRRTNLVANVTSSLRKQRGGACSRGRVGFARRNRFLQEEIQPRPGWADQSGYQGCTNCRSNYYGFMAKAEAKALGIEQKPKKMRQRADEKIDNESSRPSPRFIGLEARAQSIKKLGRKLRICSQGFGRSKEMIAIK